ncbi:hypothetical protein EJ06DRAFT_553127 [Trichodelitschia bisporula]|uniref:Uncharacterized protein n=1 Tax=Trichodelitschia bisporula TaxID=703511 RepID=A0A6G1I7G0_9PEZI|nr:hypothetical protein EJ06DRAFT_553127 [Trichodelitschia bisporula]
MAPQSVDPEDSPAFFEKLTRSHIDSIFSESEGTGSHSTTSEPIVNSTTVTSHSSPAIPHVQLFDLRRREIPSRITSESHEPTYSDDGTASLTTIDHTCSTAPTSREESPVHNIELWGVPNSLVIPTAALQYHEQQHDDGGWAKKLKEPGMADCTYPRDYLPSDRPFHEPPSFPRTRASSCTESEVGHLPPVTKTGKGDRTISRDYFPNDRPFHEPPSFPRTRTSSCTEPETSNLPPTEPTAIPEWTFLPGLGQQPLEEAIPSFPTPVPANAETVLPTAPVSGFNNPALYPRPRPATTGVKVRKAPAAVSEYRALQVYLAEYQQAAVVYAQHIKLVYQTVLERTRKECEDGLLGGCSALRNLAGMVKSLETLVRMADARVEAVEWVSHALLAHLEVEGKGGSGGC